MDFSEDSLRFFVIHQKDDQSGDRARDPKHVYCNPTKPEICPFLALGILPVSDTYTFTYFLFPCRTGQRQYERFRKLFCQRLLKDHDIQQALDEKGQRVGDLGSHSIRKGSATYCAAGTTA
ncbi:hypothetical protein GUITHDRAFT_47186, partial [Guillardia theta CCMP2712]